MIRELFARSGLMIRVEFARCVRGEVRRTDGRPSPQEQFEKGILTRDVFNWLFRPKHDFPKPAPQPGNPSLWSQAIRQADAASKQLAMQMRRDFLDKSTTMRDAMRMAHDFGLQQRAV
jgi:hypothetical protein